jgi:hypothetical protein
MATMVSSRFKGMESFDNFQIEQLENCTETVAVLSMAQPNYQVTQFAISIRRAGENLLR